MKRLRFQTRIEGGKLYDELIAAIPALAPVSGPDGVREARVLIESAADTCWLTMPDDVDTARLADVLKAHDPTPLPRVPTPAEQTDQLVTQGKAALAKAASLADIKTAMAGVLDGVGMIYGTKRP